MCISILVHYKNRYKYYQAMIYSCNLYFFKKWEEIKLFSYFCF